MHVQQNVVVAERNAASASCTFIANTPAVIAALACLDDTPDDERWPLGLLLVPASDLLA